MASKKQLKKRIAKLKRKARIWKNDYIDLFEITGDESREAEETIFGLQERIKELEARVAELEARPDWTYPHPYTTTGKTA